MANGVIILSTFPNYCSRVIDIKKSYDVMLNICLCEGVQMECR
jgi:hypothetical protein